MFFRRQQNFEHQLVLDDREITCVVERSPRRKRTIALRVQGADRVRIIAPVRFSVRSLRAFLHRQSSWIQQHLSAVPHGQPAFGKEDVLYLGRRHRLEVVLDEALTMACFLAPHRMRLHFPQAPTQHDIYLALVLWLKKRAKTKFTKRLDFWAAQLGVDYQKLVLTNAGTRWGSCTAQNVIRLNWRLIMAPLSLLDYVVVHELCHVQHKNHGRAFWQQVESVMPDFAVRRKELHKVGQSLMLSARGD